MDSRQVPRHVGEVPAHEKVVSKLEELDDIIFPAIEGDAAALEASRDAWRSAVEDLGLEAVQETRCEYLRYAQSMWQGLLRQTVQQPLRLLALMKVIGLLMGDDV